MKHRWLHRLTFFTLSPILTLFFRLRFRLKPEKFEPRQRAQGPYLILSNHAMALDPLFLAASFKGPIYYVASDIIFTMGFLSKLIKLLTAPIPKTKSRSDMETIRDIIKRVKRGYNIGIFPEGNSTFTGETMAITMATAKLVKLLKIPVVFYHFEGGYLTKPRWAHKRRKGRLRGRIHSVWEPEVYRELSLEAIDKHIKDALYVNDHVIQENAQITFKGNRLAEDFETTFYVCPACGAFHTLYSKANKIHCTQCSLEVLYTKKGQLINAPTGIKTPIDWYHHQVRASKNFLNTNSDPVLIEEHFTKTYRIEKSQKKHPIGPSKIVLKKDELILENLEDSQTFAIKDIVCAVQQKNKLIIYQSKATTMYYLVGKRKTNALKYVTLTDLINGREVY